MLRKVSFYIAGLMFSAFAEGQVLPADSLQNGGMDSVQIGSHTEFASMQHATSVTKAEGDSAYMKNDYATSIQIYETLLEQGEAAEVYYNLGNSYYKADNIAKAILNYERALLLQPGNADIRANLEIARAKTVDKVAAIPEIFFITWIENLINCLDADAWGKAGILCFLLFLVSVALFSFSKPVRLKKLGFGTGVAFLLFAICCNLFAYTQKGKLLNRTGAIVLSPSVTVRSTPSESGTALFILHEGHKVEIKDDTMREWKEIQLEDGKVGWLPTSAIEVI